ncbi:MAG: 2-oxoacid:acceptor oxidoreductase subunit alpha, partial [Paludibacter sp.]|nr:2-oxoacid:acceptor oxidoreductase subunit alpha [Paludibacter sp.]
PVILLTDGFIGNGSSLWKLPKLEDMPAIYPNYVKAGMEGCKVTARDPETRVRYWSFPGMEGFEHRNGGLEKDYTTGGISSQPDNHELMVKTRQEKVDYIANVLPDLTIEGNPDAEVLVIGWGSTRGHLLSAVKEINKKGGKVALAHFNYIQPLPKNTAELLNKYPVKLVCELNSGQFASYLRTKVPGEYLQYNKVQAQPFTVHELEDHISSLLN